MKEGGSSYFEIFNSKGFKGDSGSPESIKLLKRVASALNITFIDDESYYFFGEPQRFDFSKRIFVTSSLLLSNKFLLKIKEKNIVVVFPLRLITSDLRNIQKYKKVLQFIKAKRIKHCVLSFPSRPSEIKSPSQLIAFSEFFDDGENQKVMQKNLIAFDAWDDEA